MYLTNLTTATNAGSLRGERELKSLYLHLLLKPHLLNWIVLYAFFMVIFFLYLLPRSVPV